MRRMSRRGKDPGKLQAVIEKLVTNEPLDPSYLAHRPSGNLAPLHECHLENDWLLIWDEDDVTVTLVRTGNHSELFR